MAIAFDTAIDGGNNTGMGLSWSFTCTGSLGYLLACFAGDVIGGADDISSVTYNGVAMTLLQKITSTIGTGQRYGYIYGLAGPATGAHTLAITCASSHLLQGGSASYTGVKQTTQPDATLADSAAGTSLTSSITTVTDNDWVVLFEGGYDGGTPPVAGAGATRRAFDTSNGAWGIFDSNGVVHPAGSYSMTTTRGSDPFLLGIDHILVALKPDTGGGATVAGPLVNSNRIKGLVGGALVG
jgi:hypothetical protein